MFFYVLGDCVADHKAQNGDVFMKLSVRGLVVNTCWNI